MRTSPLALLVTLGYASVSSSFTVPLNSSESSLHLSSAPYCAQEATIPGTDFTPAKIAKLRASLANSDSASSAGQSLRVSISKRSSGNANRTEIWNHLLVGEAKARTIYDRALLVKYFGAGPQGYLDGTAWFYDARYPESYILISSETGTWDTPSLIASNHSMTTDYQLMGLGPFRPYVVDPPFFPAGITFNITSLSVARQLAQTYATSNGIQVNTSQWEIYSPPASEWNGAVPPMLVFAASGKGIEPTNPKLYVDIFFPGDTPVVRASRRVPDTTAWAQYRYKDDVETVAAVVKAWPNWNVYDVEVIPGDISAFTRRGIAFTILTNRTCFHDAFGLCVDPQGPAECDASRVFNTTYYQPFDFAKIDQTKGMMNVTAAIQTARDWSSASKAGPLVDPFIAHQFRPTDDLRKMLGQDATDTIYYKMNAASSTGQNGSVLVNTDNEKVFFTSVMNTYTVPDWWNSTASPLF